jgi:VanZ family protein
VTRNAVKLARDDPIKEQRVIEGRWFRSGCLAAAFFMAAMLFVGAETAAEIPLFPPPFDKAAHFGYFLAMGLLAFAGLGARFWWTAIPVLIAIGAADELHQLTVPGRHGSVWDFVADAVGVAVAVWIKARRAGLKDDGPIN